MTLILIDSIAEQEKSMLYDFPSNTGISTTLQASNTIEGRPNLDYKTMSLKLVAYVQLYEGGETCSTAGW